MTKRCVFKGHSSACSTAVALSYIARAGLGWANSTRDRSNSRIPSAVSGIDAGRRGEVACATARSSLIYCILSRAVR